MQGGAGNDTYIVDDVDDAVTEAAAAGTDIVQTTLAAYALTANVENLTFTGAGNFAGTGNELANVIRGGGGNDTLDGGTGNDTMFGGLGNDTYLVDSAADVINEAALAGTDLVKTTTASLTLAANVENLTFIGNGNFSGIGNALANVITGGSGNDTIDGRGGADVLIGLGGNDIYVVNDAGDMVIEAVNGGVDTVNSSVTYTLAANVENLTLTGGGNQRHRQRAHQRVGRHQRRQRARRRRRRGHHGRPRRQRHLHRGQWRRRRDRSGGCRHRPGPHHARWLTP